MRVAQNWQDYELLDCSDGEKLERWGEIILIRPDPQVLWSTPRGADWQRANARYIRSAAGGGSWDVKHLPRDKWVVRWEELSFLVQPTGFKHTGLFPEQAVNWQYLRELIGTAGRPLKVLNLFAYTGGATLACLSAGAEVCHVDASKGMLAWARENAAESGLAAKPVRWLVDDCLKFIEREQRRGNRYDGIIMDPPSYGRGPGGEVWKLEDNIYELLTKAAELLSADARFFMLSSYTAGLSAAVMQYLLSVTVAAGRGGAVTADEIGLRATHSGLILPCGSTAIWDSGLR